MLTNVRKKTSKTNILENLDQLDIDEEIKEKIINSIINSSSEIENNYDDYSNSYSEEENTQINQICDNCDCQLDYYKAIIQENGLNDGLNDQFGVFSLSLYE